MQVDEVSEPCFTEAVAALQEAQSMQCLDWSRTTQEEHHAWTPTQL